jgi:large subunit ribosomal protein L34
MRYLPPIELFIHSCIVWRQFVISNIHMSKRTYQPSKKKRATTHGFLVRSATTSGAKVIQARRRKGRAKLTVKKAQ